MIARGVLDGLGGFVGGRVVAGSLWVLQFVAPSAQRTELSKPRSELRPSCLVDRVVAALRRRTQALLSQQSCQRSLESDTTV